MLDYKKIMTWIAITILAAVFGFFLDFQLHKGRLEAMERDIIVIKSEVREEKREILSYLDRIHDRVDYLYRHLGGK